MDRVLVVPDESFPTHQAFMAEVLSKERNSYRSVFLMRTHENVNKNASWNTSPVYLFPYYAKSSVINYINSYFCMDLRYAFLVPKVVFKEKINVIHIRDLTFPLFIALILKYFFGKKVIYQKSFPMEYPRGEMARNSKRKFSSIIVFSRRCENFILHKLLRTCNAVVPISKYMADDLNRDYNIPHKKMYPFGMGFNFDQVPLQTRTGEEVPSTINLIYVGTMDKHRQIDILLYGFSLAIKQLRNYKLAFTFVGGADSDVVELQNLSRALDINDYCTFTGYIERDQVYAKIADSHIGFSWCGSATRFLPASPTKMMEYLALGIPFLAVDSILMHKEILRETGAGVLCRVEAQDAADKLTQLVCNYSTFQKKASSCVKFMEENYSYGKMRFQYKKLLDRL